MNQITCILDACSIINLVNIDDDDFLIKKLKSLDCFLCQEVFKELNNNVFTKINWMSKEGDMKLEEAEDRRNAIDKTLTIFRRKQKMDYEIEYELGDNYFDQVSNLTGYTKRNGEFYSAALALYLSRCKPIDNDKNDFVPTKLFFHTDDYPAKQRFQSFYLLQQIGHIEDTADLLILLYRINEDFTIKQLDIALSNLFVEYARGVSLLEKKLRDLRNNLSIYLARDKQFIKNLNLLLDKLHEHNFKDINQIREFFLRQKKRYKAVCDLLKLYTNVFELETDSIDLLRKIRLYRNEIKNVYRL